MFVCGHPRHTAQGIDRKRKVFPKEEEGEEFYKFLPANSADRLVQGGKDPTQCHKVVRKPFVINATYRQNLKSSCLYATCPKGRATPVVGDE